MGRFYPVSAVISFLPLFLPSFSAVSFSDQTSKALLGVDIGCGMCAVQTSLVAEDLPDSLAPLRKGIEAAIPVGFNEYKSPPKESIEAWNGIHNGFNSLMER